jgi:outer membrane lipoprotein-sorting protein
MKKCISIVNQKIILNLLLVSFCLDFSLISSAIAIPLAPVSASQKITVKRIQDYLKGIQTFKATVSQLNPDQQHLTGTVYVNRNTQTEYGKLRIEYDQAGQDLVIADGIKFILHNPKTKENTVYEIDQTPAAFLLQKNLDLEGDFTVKSLKEHDGEVELTMTKFGAGDAFVILKFSTVPMLKFNGWVVMDAQGNRTDVTLKDVVIGIDLAPSLFNLKK